MRKKIKKINWKVLLVSALIFFAISIIGSLFTSGNTNSSWYLENKPSFTPPNLVFPIVWSILYFLIALSLYFSWIKAKKYEKKKIAIMFGINLVANVLWSYLFFGIQNPLFSFIDIIIILGTIIGMILLVGKINRRAGWMLVPYLLWVSFATILNLAFLT
ncbi:tryptophan-rich sensory protein [Candidatus Pacearchaeota archaeon]|nr:tryptophan-rich sensory protein [Candidatus Pacearchaeota archaeon]